MKSHIKILTRLYVQKGTVWNTENFKGAYSVLLSVGEVGMLPTWAGVSGSGSHLPLTIHVCTITKQVIYNFHSYGLKNVT